MRNRNIKYSDAVEIRLHNRRILVLKQGENFVLQYTYARPAKDWKKKYNREYESVIERCGIVKTVKSLKLGPEAMQATFDGYFSLTHGINNPI